MPDMEAKLIKNQCRLASILKKQQVLLSENECQPVCFEGSVQTKTVEGLEKNDGEHH